MPRGIATPAPAKSDGNLATTRRRGSATLRPKGTACPRKRNGSTPAAPARRAIIRLPAKPSDWDNTPGSPAMRARRRAPWARNGRTPGGCTTCWATWPSGATTSTRPIITAAAPGRTPQGPPTASVTCFAAALGTPPPTPAARPLVWARIPVSRTHASRATRSAFVACDVQAPRNPSRTTSRENER